MIVLFVIASQFIRILLENCVDAGYVVYFDLPEKENLLFMKFATIRVCEFDTWLIWKLT